MPPPAFLARGRGFLASLTGGDLPLETCPPAGLEELGEDSMQTTKGLPLEGEPFQYHLLRKQLVLGC